jgi:PAS domain S-box-containing protein
MPQAPLHVLLIEGHDEYADVLRSWLSQSRREVHVVRCATLADAVPRLPEQHFDAVLLDLSVADAAGTDAVRRLRERAPGLAIVVLTESEDSEAATHAVQQGAQDCLVKADTNARWLLRVLDYAIERAGFQSQLAQREQLFRALIEQAHDIVVILAQTGAFLYQSPAVRRVLGYTPEELTGTNVLELIHPEDRDRAASVLGTWPLPTGDDSMFQFRLRHKDGGWRTLEALGRGFDEHPEHGIVVNARDVTDRVRAQEELRATEAMLRQAHKMEAVGRLAGGIAHDFNNVLTAIFGYSDLLLEEFPADDYRVSDIQEIRRCAERAAALTRQLLAFSRQQLLQPQVLDLNVVVDEVQRLLARTVGTQIVIAFEPAADLWLVRADPNQIAQVLMNLGINARDAMPEGGALTIRTENRSVSAREASSLPGLAPGDYVVLSVTDTGGGIPAHVRPHVFEPFFTTKQPGEGTGLGLATVYGIVKQSGGGVYVESEEGKGTTFTIFLPPHAVTSFP